MLTAGVVLIAALVSQPPLAIGREQSRDLPDDAKKACYPDCGGSPCGRGATDSCKSKLAIEWRFTTYDRLGIRY
jgi:hypothetical protein